MRTKNWSLLVLAVLALTAGSGDKHRSKLVTAAGPVLGTGTGLISKSGKRALSLGEVAIGSGVSSFRVWSPSIDGGIDTLYVGAGAAVNEYYQAGMDSVHALTVAAGAQILVIADDRP